MKILTEYKNIVDEISPIKKAYFTTFNINIQFIEKYILPPLLKGSDVKIENRFDYFDLDLELIKNNIDIKFFYDFNMLDDEELKKTTINLYPIQQKNGVFHPKVIYLEGEKGKCLFVGSSNLTKAGWSENIEAWSVIKVDENLEKQVNNFFVEVFKKAGLESGNTQDIELNDNINFIYSFDENSANFLKLIEDTKNLQVFSPYFSDDIKSIINEHLKDINISIIPDIVNQNQIRLSKKPINELKNKVKFYKYNFKKSTQKDTQTNHSKVWITDNKIAIGSYNFTKEALSGNNFEAAIIQKYEKIGDFEISNNYTQIEVESLDKKDDIYNEDETKTRYKQVFYLRADWKNRTLTLKPIQDDICVFFIDDINCYKIENEELQIDDEIEKESVFENFLKNKSFSVKQNDEIIYRGVVIEENISEIDISTKKIQSLEDMFSLTPDEVKKGRTVKEREEYERLLKSSDSISLNSDNHIEYFKIFSLFKYKKEHLKEIKEKKQVNKKQEALELFTIRGASSLLKMKEILQKEIDNGREDLELYLMVDELNDLIKETNGILENKSKQLETIKKCKYKLKNLTKEDETFIQKVKNE